MSQKGNGTINFEYVEKEDLGFITYNNKIGSNEKKARGSKSAPSENTEQERRRNAGDRQSRDEKRRTQNEDGEIAEKS